MKICFLAQFAIWGLLGFGFNTGHADTVTIDFTTDTTNGAIAVLGSSPSVDRVLNGLADSPVTEDVFEIADGGGIGAAVAGLTLSITDGTGFDSDTAVAFFNVTGSSLGINSAGTDDTDQFESALNESLTIAFNQAVNIVSIDLVSFTDSETFTVGDVNFSADDDDNTVFTFTSGTASFAANEGILLTAGNGNVGIEAITIEITAVPEPSSTMLIALGASTIGLVRRRRCT